MEFEILLREKNMSETTLKITLLARRIYYSRKKKLNLKINIGI